MRTDFNITAGLVAGFAAALFATGAQATPTLNACPPSFTANGTAKVTGPATTNTAASACQYLTPPDQSNVANTTNVNAVAFFGFADWAINGSNSQIDVEASTGSWAISGVDFASFDYMIVFKDGANTNLIGFQLNELFSSGDWTTPFVNAPFDVGPNGKDVSHYSIFQRRGDQFQVPEPAGLALLGVGLLAAGLVRRRKSA